MHSLNDYKIIKKIGKGVSSTVFLCEDKNKKWFALKKLSFVVTKYGIPLNIYRELNLLREMSSPLLVRLRDVIIGHEAMYGFYKENKIKERVFLSENASPKTKKLKDYSVESSNDYSSSPFYSSECYGEQANSPKSNAQSTSILNNYRSFNVSLIFDYCAHDLAGLILKYSGGLPRSDCASILMGLCCALKYIHTRSVMHRDIKPANVMITREGEIRLADLGLARPKDPKILRYTGNVVTHWYRAPEILKGADLYDEKIDIWAAGCVFAESLTGKPLFAADSEIVILNKIKNFLLGKDSRDVLKSIKSEDRDILEMMLKEDPAERPTASELLENGYFRGVKPMVKMDIKDCHEMEIKEEKKNPQNSKPEKNK